MAAVLSDQYITNKCAVHVTQTMQALRKPLMVAVLSHLHHSALSQPWGIRVAAVQAIAKVAVRSEEPYKLQGYTILKSLSAPDYISDPDATGELSVCLSVYLSVCLYLMWTHTCMRLLASHSCGSVLVFLAALGRDTLSF